MCDRVEYTYLLNDCGNYFWLTSSAEQEHPSTPIKCVFDMRSFVTVCSTNTGIKRPNKQYNPEEKKLRQEPAKPTMDCSLENKMSSGNSSILVPRTSSVPYSAAEGYK